MAPLTWRNVDAPNTAGVTDALRLAAQSWDSAFTGAKAGITTMQDGITKAESAKAIQKMMQYQTPEEVQAALARGELAQLDPRYLTETSLGTINGMAQNRLTEQGTAATTANTQASTARTQVLTGNDMVDRGIKEEELRRAPLMYDDQLAITEGRYAQAENDRAAASNTSNTAAIKAAQAANLPAWNQVQAQANQILRTAGPVAASTYLEQHGALAAAAGVSDTDFRTAITGTTADAQAALNYGKSTEELALQQDIGVGLQTIWSDPNLASSAEALKNAADLARRDKWSPERLKGVQEAITAAGEVPYQRPELGAPGIQDLPSTVRAPDGPAYVTPTGVPVDAMLGAATGIPAPVGSVQTSTRSYSSSTPMAAPLQTPTGQVVTPESYIRYENEGAKRNLPVSQNLASATSFLADMGIQMEVFSGGQVTKEEAARGEGSRTGSVRHDHGDAADVFFYKDGRKLDWAKPEDRPIFEEIVRQGKANGLTGFGAGPGYMQAGSMHIGFGAPAVWGKSTGRDTAPDWLVAAYDGAPAGTVPNNRVADGSQTTRSITSTSTPMTAAFQTPEGVDQQIDAATMRANGIPLPEPVAAPYTGAATTAAVDPTFDNAVDASINSVRTIQGEGQLGDADLITPSMQPTTGSGRKGDPVKSTGIDNGLVERGNLDLGGRPVVALPDGSVATVHSVSFEEDGKEVLVPTITKDGKVLSEEEAIAEYKRTGEHLGKFKDVASANAYAEALSADQGKEYGNTVKEASKKIKPTGATSGRVIVPADKAFDDMVDAAVAGTPAAQPAAVPVVAPATTAVPVAPAAVTAPVVTPVAAPAVTGNEPLVTGVGSSPETKAIEERLGGPLYDDAQIPKPDNYVPAVDTAIDAATNPDASAFQRTMGANNVRKETLSIAGEIDRGAYGGPGGSPGSQLVGGVMDFFAPASEAKKNSEARNAASKAAEWWRSDDAQTYFTAHPEQLAAAKGNPVAVAQQIMNASPQAQLAGTALPGAAPASTGVSAAVADGAPPVVSFDEGVDVAVASGAKALEARMERKAAELNIDNRLVPLANLQALVNGQRAEGTEAKAPLDYATEIAGIRGDASKAGDITRMINTIMGYGIKDAEIAAEILKTSAGEDKVLGVLWGNSGVSFDMGVAKTLAENFMSRGPDSPMAQLLQQAETNTKQMGILNTALTRYKEQETKRDAVIKTVGQDSPRAVATEAAFDAEADRILQGLIDKGLLAAPSK